MVSYSCLSVPFCHTILALNQFKFEDLMIVKVEQKTCLKKKKCNRMRTKRNIFFFLNQVKRTVVLLKNCTEIDRERYKIKNKKII